eukprot:5475060-Lingulodinium_polyedra.AAC.1
MDRRELVRAQIGGAPVKHDRVEPRDPKFTPEALAATAPRHESKILGHHPDLLLPAPRLLDAYQSQLPAVEDSLELLHPASLVGIA